MNGGGVLLEDKDPRIVAAAIDRVLNDAGFRQAVVNGQARTLAAARAVDFGTLLETHVETALKSAGARA